MSTAVESRLLALEVGSRKFNLQGTAVSCFNLNFNPHHTNRHASNWEVVFFDLWSGATYFFSFRNPQNTDITFADDQVLYCVPGVSYKCMGRFRVYIYSWTAHGSLTKVLFQKSVFAIKIPSFYHFQREFKSILQSCDIRGAFLGSTNGTFVNGAKVAWMLFVALPFWACVLLL